MAERLTPNDICVSFQDRVTTQEYGGARRIDGVQFIDLRLMADDGGSFAELIRLDEHGCLEAIPSFQVRQSSYSQVQPGTIKAFHLHYNQEDVWFVPPGDRMLVGLFDLREHSPTAQVSMRFMLGGAKAQLLYIPRGVAHGAANLGTAPATIVYFVNQQFNLADPDERRVPWDILGADFWEPTPG
jgi:dTDP-4-dehydrorhamnose 3,5-epimerase